MLRNPSCRITENALHLICMSLNNNYVSFFKNDLFLPQFRTSFFFPVIYLFLWNRVGNGGLIRFTCIDRKCSRGHLHDGSIFEIWLFSTCLMLRCCFTSSPMPDAASKFLSKKLTFICLLAQIILHPVVNENQMVHAISNSVATYFAAITNRHFREFSGYIIQLFPEGEVNSGVYIPRREASRYISTSLHRLWGV